MPRMSEDALLDAALASPDMAPFAMFDLDLGGMTDPQTGDLVFPEFNGQYTPLWRITQNGEETQRQREHAKQVARTQTRALHLERVKALAKRIDDGLPLFEENAPLDEWHRFWGGLTPTEKLAQLDIED